MAGLPRKDTNLRDNYIYADGRPKEDSLGHQYLIQEKLKSFNEGYTVATNDFNKLLYTHLYNLISMNFEEYDKLPELPNSFEMLKPLLKCVRNYSEGLRSQINNTNKTNYREGSRGHVLFAERALKVKRGTFLNKLIRAYEKRIGTNRPKHKEDKPVSVKPIEDKNFISDPTDELINVVTEETDNNN